MIEVEPSTIELDEGKARAIVAALNAVQSMEKALRRDIDHIFYTTARAYRATGMTTPQSYQAALNTLNTALEPYRTAYQT